MIAAVEQFEEALCVLAGGLAGEVLGMDSTSEEKCTFAAGLASVGGWGRFSGAADLLSVVVFALLVGVQCVHVFRYALRYTPESATTGLNAGGEGVSSGLAVCAYDPFRRGKFICIASTFLGFAAQPTVEAFGLNCFSAGRPKNKKRRAGDAHEQPTGRHN